MADQTSEADRELIMERDFDAPRALVWRAWTEPEHLPQWWGPRDFTITTLAIDVRPGGMWRYLMHAPDGTDYDNRITFREFTPPERIVYEHGTDKDDDPEQFVVTVTFSERDSKTHLTMRILFPTVAQREANQAFGAVEIGYQTLAHLAEHLATMA